MRNRVHPFLRNLGLGSLLAVCLFASAAAQACTIFVLGDTNQVLFCNNMDWKGVPTRIWFAPSQKHYACAYVGVVFLGLSVSEGGFNTQGLAFSYIRYYRPQKWRRQPEQKIVRGVPHERMLESCATVEEAIAFYRTHWEPALRVAEVLMADRTGAWAILSAKNGHLEVFRGSGPGGDGWGAPVLARMLPQNAQPTLTNAVQILYATRAGGKYATRYSFVFDSRAGNIFLLLPGRSEPARLNLAEELKRGPHFYDMSRIDEQRSARPKRLSFINEWVRTVYCPLRNNRLADSQEPRVALRSPKDRP